MSDKDRVAALEQENKRLQESAYWEAIKTTELVDRLALDREALRAALREAREALQAKRWTIRPSYSDGKVRVFAETSPAGCWVSWESVKAALDRIDAHAHAPIATAADVERVAVAIWETGSPGKQRPAQPVWETIRDEARAALRAMGYEVKERRK